MLKWINCSTSQMCWLNPLEIQMPSLLSSSSFPLVLILYRKSKRLEKLKEFSLDRNSLTWPLEKDKMKLLKEEFMKVTKKDIGSCLRTCTLCPAGFWNLRKSLTANKVTHPETPNLDSSFPPILPKESPFPSWIDPLNSLMNHLMVLKTTW